MEAGQYFNRRRKKNLIISVLMVYDPWRKIFNCGECDDKRGRGCLRPKRKAIVEIACMCGGSRHCDICKGTGEIKIKRCPGSYMRSSEIISLMPYFFRYKATWEYPDKMGRMEQPIKLTDALDLMSAVSNRKEQEQLEKIHGRK